MDVNVQGQVRASKDFNRAGYLFYFKTSEVMIPIVRMHDGIVYDQEGGNAHIYLGERRQSRSPGFTEFVEKKKQESLFRLQERKRHHETLIKSLAFNKNIKFSW